MQNAQHSTAQHSTAQVSSAQHGTARDATTALYAVQKAQQRTPNHQEQLSGDTLAAVRNTSMIGDDIHGCSLSITSVRNVSSPPTIKRGRHMHSHEHVKMGVAAQPTCSCCVVRSVLNMSSSPPAQYNDRKRRAVRAAPSQSCTLQVTHIWQQTATPHCKMSHDAQRQNTQHPNGRPACTEQCPQMTHLQTHIAAVRQHICNRVAPFYAKHCANCSKISQVPV
jgi:hypothetical protein